MDEIETHLQVCITDGIVSNATKIPQASDAAFVKTNRHNDRQLWENKQQLPSPSSSSKHRATCQACRSPHFDGKNISRHDVQT
jgi:hypothetical protein